MNSTPTIDPKWARLSLFPWVGLMIWQLLWSLSLSPSAHLAPEFDALISVFWLALPLYWLWLKGQAAFFVASLINLGYSFHALTLITEGNIPLYLPAIELALSLAFYGLAFIYLRQIAKWAKAQASKND